MDWTVDWTLDRNLDRALDYKPLVSSSQALSLYGSGGVRGGVRGQVSRF